MALVSAGLDNAGILEPYPRDDYKDLVAAGVTGFVSENVGVVRVTGTTATYGFDIHVDSTQESVGSNCTCFSLFPIVFLSRHPLVSFPLPAKLDPRSSGE